jgi:hypothetical protein
MKIKTIEILFNSDGGTTGGGTDETITITKAEHEKFVNESAELVKLKENKNNSAENQARIKELEISVNSLQSEKESITKKYNELEGGIKQQYYDQLSDEHKKIAQLIPTVEGLAEYVKLNAQKTPAGSDSTRPGAGISDYFNSKWDELNYNEKEELRKKRPELWRKLYREKFGSNP